MSRGSFRDSLAGAPLAGNACRSCIFEVLWEGSVDGLKMVSQW
jgi:hypothetical protein